MPDTSRPVDRKIADAIERMKRVQDAARGERRPEPVERRAEDQAVPGPPRR